MKCNWICSRCPYWHECPEYKPKPEEQMTDKRVIFESEREALEFIKILGDNTKDEDCVKALKQAGYIRRNPVEEAEEMYKNYRGDCDTETFHLIQKQHEAIQYLKERQK